MTSNKHLQTKRPKQIKINKKKIIKISRKLNQRQLKMKFNHKLIIY